MRIPSGRRRIRVAGLRHLLKTSPTRGVRSPEPSRSRRTHEHDRARGPSPDLGHRDLGRRVSGLVRIGLADGYRRCSDPDVRGLGSDGRGGDRQGDDCESQGTHHTSLPASSPRGTSAPKQTAAC